MTRAQLLASTKVPQDTQYDVGPRISRFELLPTAALHPNPCNPRKHIRDQIRRIARSIEAFGFNAPILIDKDKKIIAGHGRYEAAKYLGYAKVPVIWLDHLNEVQARGYMLADNKLTDRSSWDDAALALQLKELSELALDFDIEAIGFEPPELDVLIQSLDSAEQVDRADEFAVTSEPAVSRPGELWLMDGHRLWCGDALDLISYETLLELDRASAIFTDPPYNVKINGHVGGKGAVKHSEFAMASGEMTSDEFRQFLTASMKLASAYTTSGSVIYTFMDWRHIDEMLAAGRAQGWEFANLCVWVKSNGGMGSFYRSNHELVFVFRQGGDKSVNNVQLGRFGRNRTNVWNYPGATSFPRKGAKRNLDIHPTTKPIALVADAILDSTQRNDIVLDPFLGSGTTILAAHRTARRCYGVEIEPIYVDTAIQRWQNDEWERCASCLGRDLRRNQNSTVGRHMSAGSDDDKVGYKRPPMQSRWKKGQSGSSGRRTRAPVAESTVAMIDRLLLAPIQITINGEASKVSTLEAIVFQILQKAMSDNARAYRILLQYQEFANENLEKKLELTFLDSDYTQAFAAQTRGTKDA